MKTWVSHWDLRSLMVHAARDSAKIWQNNAGRWKPDLIVTENEARRSKLHKNEGQFGDYKKFAWFVSFSVRLMLILSARGVPGYVLNLQCSHVALQYERVNRPLQRVGNVNGD